MQDINIFDAPFLEVYTRCVCVCVCVCVCQRRSYTDQALYADTHSGYTYTEGRIGKGVSIGVFRVRAPK